MKKLALLIGLSTCALTAKFWQQNDGPQQLARAKQVDLKHKQAWMKLMGDMTRQKEAALAKETERLFNFDTATISELCKLQQNRQPEAVNKYAHERALEAIKVYEENLTALNDLFLHEAQAKEDLFMREMEELNKLRAEFENLSVK